MSDWSIWRGSRARSASAFSSINADAPLFQPAQIAVPALAPDLVHDNRGYVGQIVLMHAQGIGQTRLGRQNHPRAFS